MDEDPKHRNPFVGLEECNLFVPGCENLRKSNVKRVFFAILKCRETHQKKLQYPEVAITATWNKRVNGCM